MEYTIHGFSQEIALGFRKEIETNGKKTIIKLDCTDLLLLRWFVDFYPQTNKENIDGKEYGWISYEKVLEDLPLLDLGIKIIYNKFEKMTEFGILEHKHVKEEGSYYGFGENYKLLIDTKNNSNPKEKNIFINFVNVVVFNLLQYTDKVLYFFYKKMFK